MPKSRPKAPSPAAYTLADLIAVMARLRNPDDGCPWDLAQDFKSIAPYTIEEAYEVANAIDRGDMNDLREELGDLLLQSVYHAQMAAEMGAFNIHDVIRDVTAKMIDRHPHVFGNVRADTPDDANAIWENRKGEEKGEKASALDGVAAALPALLRAYKLLGKAAKTGFRWPDSDAVFEKFNEEVNELKQAIAAQDAESIREELGDVLFVLAALARQLEIDPEESLRQANNKFIKRFMGMEQDFKNSGQAMEDATLEQMLAMWRRQKSRA